MHSQRGRWERVSFTRYLIEKRIKDERDNSKTGR